MTEPQTPLFKELIQEIVCEINGICILDARPDRVKCSDNHLNEIFSDVKSKIQSLIDTEFKEQSSLNHSSNESREKITILIILWLFEEYVGFDELMGEIRIDIETAINDGWCWDEEWVGKKTKSLHEQIILKMGIDIEENGTLELDDNLQYDNLQYYLDDYCASLVTEVVLLIRKKPQEKLREEIIKALTIYLLEGAITVIDEAFEDIKESTLLTIKKEK